VPKVKARAAAVARFIAEDGHAQLVLYDDGALMLEVPYKDAVQIAKWGQRTVPDLGRRTGNVPRMVEDCAMPTKETP
jgi:hypothetical protein